MIYIKAFFDSIILSYYGLVGGTLDGKGKTYYVLWTMHLFMLRKTEIKNVNFQTVRELKCIIYARCKKGL